MPPLPKTCPKMVLSIKGVALCERCFCKKIFWCRERFRWARSHRFFGNTLTEGRTPDAVALCQALFGSRPSRGTGTCRPDSERFRSTPRTSNHSIGADSAGISSQGINSGATIGATAAQEPRRGPGRARFVMAWKRQPTAFKRAQKRFYAELRAGNAMWAMMWWHSQ